MIFSYGEPHDTLPATASEAMQCEYSLPVLALERRFAYLLLFSYGDSLSTYSWAKASASLSLYRLSSCCGQDMLNPTGGLFVQGDSGDPHCEKCKRSFPDLAMRPHSYTFWDGLWDGTRWDSSTVLEHSVRGWSELSGFDLFEAQLTLTEFCIELKERLQAYDWLRKKNVLTIGL